MNILTKIWLLWKPFDCSPRLSKAYFIIVLLCLLLATPATIYGQEEYNPIIVRISKAAYDNLTNIPIVQTIDYGTFVQLELTQASFQQLQASGIPYQRETSSNVIIFNDITIDTQVAPPITTARNTPVSTKPGLFLVQLVGPAKDMWLTELRDNGLVVLQYSAPYIYLVRATPAQISKIETRNFVRWIGPYKAEYSVRADLRTRAEQSSSGTALHMNVTIYDDGTVDGTVARTITQIEALGGVLIEREPKANGDSLVNTIFSLPAASVFAVTELPDVIWLNERATTDEYLDEMSNQIIIDPSNTLTANYSDWLTAKGVSGQGVIVSLLDSGYDTGEDASSHPDIRGRLIPIENPIDSIGHGTHVGGIIAGNASLSVKDASGFHMGLGVAPDAQLVARLINVSDATRASDSVINGAVVSNHSYAVHATNSGYTVRDRTYDILTRDANLNTTSVAEPLIMVFAAGNSAQAGLRVEAKNVIAVGSTRNQRDMNGNPGSGNVQTVSSFSSRGPAKDGRIVPQVVAPGENIVSTVSSQSPVLCSQATAGAPSDGPGYALCSGTSMAAPHVAGGIALITEWWRDVNDGATPSPALAKGLLVNGATDLGTPDIPNKDEGWGLINLDNVINPDTSVIYIDQSVIFGETGQTWSGEFSAVDPNKPVKVTLVWTDAPGTGLGGQSKALVNDLDLVVQNGGNQYFGNVFANGFSITGGAASRIDNLENVFIKGMAGNFTVNVIAASINGDGIPYNGDLTDQDFALIVYNATIPNVDTAAEITEDDVTLVWQIASDIIIAEYNLYRATAQDGAYSKVETGSMMVNHDSGAIDEFAFTAERMPSDPAYYYKLQITDIDGVSSVLAPVWVPSASDGVKAPDNNLVFIPFVSH